MDPERNDSRLSRRRVLASIAGGIGVVAAGTAGVAVAQSTAPTGGKDDGTPGAVGTPASPATVTVDFHRRLGAMNIDRFALGQGGFSPEPMFPTRTADIRALRPRVIRLFLQPYYDLLPAPGKYNFATLDASIDLILKAGATPLLCMVFKPKSLFPRIDQDLVVPTSWEAWDELVYRLVQHYTERNGGGWYWEVGNEWDLKSGGGSPYHMTPDQYTLFYRHTATAVRRADPKARVGGPAQAHPDAKLIPALLSFCEKNKFPLDFISWHGYQNDPKWFGKTTRAMQSRVAQHPGLHPELVIDEWNIALGQGYVDPRFQPAFVAETTYQMLKAGLDLACYYQIRDYPFAEDLFKKFYPAADVAEQQIFWDRRPVYLGLFDYEDQPRPAYYVFKLLERLTGDQIGLTSNSATVHGLATADSYLKTGSILLWNYSESPAIANLRCLGVPRETSVWRFVLDATGPSSDYNARLRPQPIQKIAGGDSSLSFPLSPWEVTQISLGLD